MCVRASGPVENRKPTFSEARQAITLKTLTSTAALDAHFSATCRSHACQSYHRRRSIETSTAIPPTSCQIDPSQTP